MNEMMQNLIARHRILLAALEDRLGYRFGEVEHLQQALIHSSYAFEQGTALGLDNERLEFLGDAVLDLAVGHALYAAFPEMKEGELTRLRAALVNEGHLAQMARDIELGGHLLLGRGEDISQGRQKSSILSSAYEAIIGAIYLDAGFGASLTFVRRHFTPWFEKSHTTMLLADAKSGLQELLQEKFNEAPVYVVDREEGPDHDKRFTVSVRFRETVLGTGSARSKKEAEQQAAAAALQDAEALNILT